MSKSNEVTLYRVHVPYSAKRPRLAKAKATRTKLSYMLSSEDSQAFNYRTRIPCDSSMIHLDPLSAWKAYHDRLKASITETQRELLEARKNLQYSAGVLVELRAKHAR